MAFSDSAAFLREWMRSPSNVAAVAPSGRALAALITEGIAQATGPVLELGPGTGAFTRALIRRGVPEGDLTLVEYSDEFAQRLRIRYPDARVLKMDAAHVTRDETFPGMPPGAAVCGLGLLNMPPAKIRQIVRGVFSSLRDDGFLQLFTYGPRCSVPREILDELGLQAQRIGKTWRNIPPASVYRIARRR